MSLRALVATFALSVSLLVAPAQAAPQTYSAPELITGTHGGQASVPVIASAPNGADAIVWAANPTPGNTLVSSLLRKPGTTTWLPVATPVPLQTLPINAVDVVGTVSGDFWAVFVLGFTQPQVYAMKLTTATATWGAPVNVFAAQPAEYHYGGGVSQPMIDIADDGTVTVVSIAQDITQPTQIRVAAGTLAPGAAAFTNEYLTDVGIFNGLAVAVSGPGHVLVTFTTGSNLNESVTWAATRGPGTAWTLKNLTAPGDGGNGWPAVGRDGTAVVTFQTPSLLSKTVNVATTKLGAGTPTWSVAAAPAAPGDLYVFSPRAVVEANGDVTVVWGVLNGASNVIHVSQLKGGAFSPAKAVTPVESTAALQAVEPFPDGRVEILLSLNEPNTFVQQGNRVVTLLDSTVASTQTLTSGAPYTIGDLASDAASRGTIVVPQGNYPDQDVAWQGLALGAPQALVNHWSGLTQTKAKVKKKGKKKKHKLSCTSEVLFVEASGPATYQWFRGKKAIKKAKAKKPVYKWKQKDVGKKLSCRITASNAVGKVVLKSNKRKIKG